MSINNFLLNTIFQNKHIKVLVTYGSQTGNVEAVSQILFNKINLQFKEIKEMNAITDIKQLDEYDYVFFLVSTTGDGEFPDNADKFWRIIKKYKDPVNFQYGLIGFGDSNYRSFCHTSKCLSRILKKLKAEEVFPLVQIDDALDDSPKIEQWIEDVYVFLKKKQSEVQNIFTRLMNS